MNIKFSKLFDWSIKSVESPKYYFDKKDNFEAYEVRVTYNHHGTKSVLFDIHNNDSLYVNNNNPYYAAYEYYNKMKQKMQNQKQR